MSGTVLSLFLTGGARCEYLTFPRLQKFVLFFQKFIQEEKSTFFGNILLLHNRAEVWLVRLSGAIDQTIFYPQFILLRKYIEHFQKVKEKKKNKEKKKENKRKEKKTTKKILKVIKKKYFSDFCTIFFSDVINPTLNVVHW